MTRRHEGEHWEFGENRLDAYERYLVPIFFAPWAEQLVQLVAPGPGERMLDVACGTGIVARRAAMRVGAGGTVTGLDRNESIIELARRASVNVRPAIEWRIGDVTDMPFPEGAFDVVFCQQALHLFPDRPAALREMHRVLAPNGRLALNVSRSIQHNPGHAALAAVVERHVSRDDAAMLRSIFPAWSVGFLRELVMGAGFPEVRIRISIGAARFPSPAEFLRQQAASSPLAGPIGALGVDAREVLIRDLEEALGSYTDDEGVVFPTEAYMIVARGHAATQSTG